MASSSFVQALVEFALEDPANLVAVQDLRATCLTALFATPDGAVVTQVSGSLNGKTFMFSVDRKGSELLGDIGEVLRIVAGDVVRGTYLDVSRITH